VNAYFDPGGPMPGNPVTGQTWNPSVEVVPGGPHPAVVMRLQAEERLLLEAEGQRRTAEADDHTHALLLLRR
jgi:hypothetical protein